MFFLASVSLRNDVYPSRYFKDIKGHFYGEHSIVGSLRGSGTDCRARSKNTDLPHELLYSL